MFKYLINLNNRLEKSWSAIDFKSRDISIDAGWYVAEFQLSGVLKSTPRLIVENRNQQDVERVLEGAHSGRNRMLFYLPQGKLSAMSRSLDFERLAKLSSVEARFRIALICLRYLLDFPRPSVFFKMVLMQFQTPFELSSKLLTFYEPARGGSNYLSNLEKWHKYQRFRPLFQWITAGIKVAVIIEHSEQEKSLKEQLLAPDYIINSADQSSLPADVDYFIALKSTEKLRFPAIYLIKRAIAKARSNSASKAMPLLLYTDHDYAADDTEVLPPVFKPQASLAYLYCYNYIGFSIVMNKQLLEGQSPQDLLEHRVKYQLALEALKIAKKDKRLPELVLPISEALFLTSANQHSTTSPPDTQNSSWTHIEWRRDGDFNRLRASTDWQSGPTIDLVIPTRDGLSVLRPCIDSILEKTTYLNYKIVIVDNDSQEQATLDYFKELELNERVSVLSYPGEFNYSAINNFAVANSKADYIGLINNDIEVISADWLEQMMVWAIQDEVGIVGAKLLFSDGKIQHAGVTIGMGNAAGHIHRLEDGDALGYQCRCQATQNMMAVTAACLITERSLFNKLGGLNETDFKVAYNDIDYCLRVESLGFEVIWTPEARLYHHESVSRGDDMSDAHIDRYMKELQHFQRRWKSKGFVDKYYSKHLRISDEGVFPNVEHVDSDDLKFLRR